MVLYALTLEVVILLFIVLILFSQKERKMRFAFLFPAITGIQEGMGQDLVARWPVARETFTEANDILGYNFMHRCFDSSLDELAASNYMRLLSTLTVGISVQRILAQEGIEPEMVTGMSAGLFPSMVTAGCISFEQALRFLVQRSELFDAIPADKLGTVLLVITANEEVCRQVEKISEEEDVPIALYNNAKQVSFAGTHEEIERVRARLKQVRGVFTPKLSRYGILNANHARHFLFMLEPWRKLVDTLSIEAPKIPIALSGSNAITSNPEHILEAVLEFDIRPSLWRQTFSRLLYLKYYDVFFELGVGHHLTNIARAWDEQPVVLPCGLANEIDGALTYVYRDERKSA